MADWSLIFNLESYIEVSKNHVSLYVTYSFVSTSVGNHMSTSSESGKVKRDCLL